MKRFSFWIIISVFTFFLGICAVLTWLYYDQKQIVEVEPVTLFDNSCLQSKSFPGLSKKISEIQKGKSGHFPKAVFDNSDFFADFYGMYLKSMDEKSLLNFSNNNREVYRFLWLRSFHHPIFVRIEKTDNSIQIFSKELDGRANGDDSRKVLRSEKKILDEQQWCIFLRLLEKSEYWKMPNGDKIGRDGAQWILEGVRENRYHIVDRWSPGDKSGFGEACVYLLKLSGIDTDKLGDELY